MPCDPVFRFERAGEESLEASLEASLLVGRGGVAARTGTLEGGMAEFQNWYLIIGCMLVCEEAMSVDFEVTEIWTRADGEDEREK